MPLCAPRPLRPSFRRRTRGHDEAPPPNLGADAPRSSSRRGRIDERFPHALQRFAVGRRRQQLGNDFVLSLETSRRRNRNGVVSRSTVSVVLPGPLVLRAWLRRADGVASSAASRRIADSARLGLSNESFNSALDHVVCARCNHRTRPPRSIFSCHARG